MHELLPPLRGRASFQQIFPSFHTYTIIDVGFSIFRYPREPDIALSGTKNARSHYGASINLITLTSVECSTTCFGQSIIQNLQYPKLFQCRYSSLLPPLMYVCMYACTLSGYVFDSNDAGMDSRVCMCGCVYVHSRYWWPPMRFAHSNLTLKITRQYTHYAYIIFRNLIPWYLVLSVSGVSRV